jgi:hypothetical protein
VVELDVVELILEGPHGLAVRLHLIVVAARVFHDLVNHELRAPPHVEPFDAYLDGDLEAAKQGLVLSHVVRCGEAKVHSVPHVLPEGRDEEQAHTRTYLHHRAVEVQGPAFSLDLWRRQLRVRPLGYEICQDLGHDGLARGVGERFTHQLHRPLGNPARCIRVTDDFP